jgi:hypothetical protein
LDGLIDANTVCGRRLRPIPARAGNCLANNRTAQTASAPDPRKLRAKESRTRTIAASGQNRRVDLARVGWIVTVVGCLLAVLVLLLQGYYGYALVTFAVAVSAAFNLT